MKSKHKFSYKRITYSWSCV